MARKTIDSIALREMYNSGAALLTQNREAVDSLNVFPVPDGDTGTNMTMTIVSAAKQVNACTSNCVGMMMHELSGGALKGARGNSGVILSQLFRGFAQSAEKTKEVLTAEDFAKAIRMGVDAAYKAVMKPKEGTILTVAKAMAQRAEVLTAEKADIFHLLDGVIEAADEMLKKTPEMLPVLKEAGVVDAGGAGLLAIYKGFKMALEGEEVPAMLDLTIPDEEKRIAASAMSDISTADIEFGYCTEFFIVKEENDISQEAVDKLRDKLLGIGDSLVVVGTEDLVKVHVHTNVPGRALQYALRLGQLSKIKIENMREQHTALMEEAPAPTSKQPQKELAMVAVAAGAGLEGILREFGVDAMVEGGQSMNPSIEDIRAAIEAVPSQNVIVFPNNKNIILAAEQAGALTEKNVSVIPTRSFPQGLDAVLAFNPTVSLEENTEEMKEAMLAVKTGEITHAVRDTRVNGFEIHEGDMLGLEDGDIVVCTKNMEDTLEQLVAHMVDPEESSVIALYYGKDVAAEDAEAAMEKLQEIYEDCDVEVYEGGQDVYQYIISVE